MHFHPLQKQARLPAPAKPAFLQMPRPQTEDTGDATSTTDYVSGLFKQINPNSTMDLFNFNSRGSTPTPPPSESKHSSVASSSSAPSAKLGSPLPPTAFASLSFHRNDRVRLLAFPAHIIAGMRESIVRHWSKGIQEARPFGGSYEFKLGGNPWSSDGTGTRVLVRELLAYLHLEGWLLHASSNVSKSPADKETLVFRKHDTAPPATDWLAVSFDRTDRMRLVGAGVDLAHAVATMLRASGLLHKDVGRDPYWDLHEFKLRGHPWQATGEETMAARLLLLKMLEILERFGYSLYASVEQNSVQGESVGETPTWYCVKSRKWRPGDPVAHS